MKKLLFIFVVWLFTIPFFSFASPTIDITQEELEELITAMELDATNEYQSQCAYSDKEKELLFMIRDLFTKHAESRIVQRLFTNDQMKDLVRNFTAEYLQSITNAISYCQWSDRLWPFPYNYSELESGLIQYVNTILQLKWHEVRLWASDPAAYGFDQLRNILMWENFALMQEGVRLDQVFNMMLGIQSTSEDDVFGLNLDVWVESVWAADGSMMLWSITMWWDIRVESEYENINTWWDMSAEIRLVDDHMYLKLESFDIALGDIAFANQYEADSFNGMMQMVKLFQWKYIDIPLGIEWDMIWNPFMMYGEWLGGLEIQQEMMNMMQQDRLTTTHIEDGITYAWINPLACSAMEMMWWIAPCLEARQDMMDHTDGKGMFFMTQQWWETNMWITDIFAGDWMPEEMRKIANQPLLSWNADEITRVDIPLYDEDALIGKFLYENNRVTMNVRFPTQEYDRETWNMTYADLQVNGTANNKQVDLLWTITWPNIDAEFSLNWWWTLESMVLDMSVSVKDTGQYPMNFSMTMKLDSSQVVTNPVNISAPDPSEIIDMGSLMAY